MKKTPEKIVENIINILNRGIGCHKIGIRKWWNPKRYIKGIFYQKKK